MAGPWAHIEEQLIVMPRSAARSRPRGSRDIPSDFDVGTNGRDGVVSAPRLPRPTPALGTDPPPLQQLFMQIAER
jgi:hypothetical protein